LKNKLYVKLYSIKFRKLTSLKIVAWQVTITTKLVVNLLHVGVVELDFVELIQYYLSFFFNKTIVDILGFFEFII
jgi:hypothetical protein